MLRKSALRHALGQFALTAVIAVFGLFGVASALQADEVCHGLELQAEIQRLGIPSFGSSNKLPYIAGKLGRLSRYDEAAWLELMHFFQENGDPDAALTNDLLPLMRLMPPELRAKLDSFVSEIYPQSSSSNDIRFDGGKVVFPPKRALSAYMHVTSDPYELMRSMRAEGKSAETMLDSYFEVMRQRFFRGQKDFHYDANAVFETARFLQQTINQALAKDPSAAPKGYELFMFGSFTNGRANFKSSDIDVVSTNPEIRNLMNPYYQSVRNKVAETIPGAAMSLGFPSAPITPEQASPIGPVQVRIRQNEIHLLVFPAFGISKAAFTVIGQGISHAPRPLEIRVL